MKIQEFLRNYAIKTWLEIDPKIQKIIHSDPDEGDFQELLETDDYMLNWFLLETLCATRYFSNPILMEIEHDDYNDHGLWYYEIEGKHVMVKIFYGQDYPEHLNHWSFVEKKLVTKVVEEWVEVKK